MIERKGLALVFAVQIPKFQKHLYGKEFVLQTNHQPSAYIQIDSTRIICWVFYLQNYRFRTQSIKGTEKVGADFMSRLCK